MSSRNDRISRSRSGSALMALHIKYLRLKALRHPHCMLRQAASARIRSVKLPHRACASSAGHRVAQPLRLIRAT